MRDNRSRLIGAPVSATPWTRLRLMVVLLIVASIVPRPTLPLVVAAGPLPPERVSVSSTGTEANNSSTHPSLSADGRYVAFESKASNLVPDDTNKRQDVFVYDRQTGDTTRVSVSTTGTEANGDSGAPSISADGRFIAFESKAINLVPSAGTGDKRQGVYVHDRETGETTRVSSSAGVVADGDSGAPAISADGRFVAFESKATNLVIGDTNKKLDVFVHDRQTGDTTRVSVSSAGVEGDGDSGSPSISADGRFVAFQSKASNLVISTLNKKQEVYVHDRQTGETTRVSVSSAGVEGDGDSGSPSISADGRFVAFESKATTLVIGDTNKKLDVFVHDRQTGDTTRVSMSTAGLEGDGDSGAPSIGADGRFVAFQSKATTLVTADVNKKRDVFVHDRQTGETARLSDPDGLVEADKNSEAPAISGDGNVVAFASLAANLVSSDTNKKEDVFVVQRNRAPVAVDDEVTTDQNTAVNVTVLTNDSDPDGDSLTVTGVTQGAHGAVTLAANTATYTPASGFVGGDSFTYTISDGRGGTAMATVDVTVKAIVVNQAPIVTAGAVQATITLPASASLTATVSDDGLPNPPGAVTTTWSKFSGPGDVSFTDASALDTSASFSMDGSYVLRFSAFDGQLTMSSDVTITVKPAGPPDPSTVAPPVDPTLSSALGKSTEFLYTGPNPIQTGVASGTMNPARVSVLRGHVLDRNNAALPGVTITILGHPEFGQTLSRADGGLDMAVNGGALLTVNYAKAGFLSAQRQVKAPWQDYATLPDVVLVPLDSQVTTIDLTAAVAMQAATANPVTDADGTRQATLLFPQGTQAQMVMPDGSTQALSTLNVRATEFTVGASGPSAMPGELPPNSGYTYAVELSVDEALSAGASTVTFNPPVPFYVQNFVGFPVGSLVPAGFYDRGKGQWVASANGRVIKIISITGGLADLDVDGDGSVDGATALAALGITDAERARLATLFAPGQSVWRVLIPHFSPWDCNWPYGPPDNAEPPKPKPKPKDDPPKGPKPDCRNGSVIECETQTLGESVAIAGTSYRLHYRSDSVPGRRAATVLETRLTEATLPPGLQRIHVEVHVAGREFKDELAPAPNLFHTFTWDGMDVYGRRLVGAQPVTVRVGFEYLAQYYATPDSFAASFNRFGGAPITIARGAGGAGGGSGGGGAVAFSLVAARQMAPPIIIYAEYTSTIGTLAGAPSDALGSWTFDRHHSYDIVGQVLHRGDGTQKGPDSSVRGIASAAGQGTSSSDGVPATQAKVHTLALVSAPDGSLYFPDLDTSRIRRISADGIISTVAGGGSFCASGPCGEGGLATQAYLELNSQGLALGPDGVIYLSDRSRFVRRIGLDGIITTIAGTGTACSPSSPTACGDGGPARQADMVPTALAAAPDGSVYVVDGSITRIRRIAPDGTITTAAGNGDSCPVGTLPCGDGGQATAAQLHISGNIAVGPDGSLYIPDSNLGRVRRVRPNGIIVNVAGNGSVCSSSTAPCGDGGPATQAQFNSGPIAVIVGVDGALYIADLNGGRVRRVGPEGIITTVAGNGSSSGITGDGGFPTAASIPSPRALAMSPDGKLFVVHNSGTRIRVVTAAAPRLQIGEFPIASEDGAEIYIFTGDGRHQRTLEALTGAVRLQFSYDTDGRLSAISDPDGNVTTIERNGTGAPTAIVAPGGSRTALVLGGDGYLASVTDPAGGTTGFTYNTGDADGLLATLTDPRNNVHRFFYDSLGRLVRDENPAGGVTTLARTDVTSDRYTVTVATAAGPTTIYDVEELSTGETHRIRTDPSGARQDTLVHTDGSRQSTYPDGTVTNLALAGDPRWGLQMPVLVSLTTTTPGGLAQTLTSTRTVTLANSADIFSLQTLTTTFTLNGRTATVVYQASTGTITLTSPAGRQATATLDARGRVIRHRVVGLNETVYTYNAQGQLTDATTGTGAEARTSHITYNASQQISGGSDPLGRPTSFTYDAVGRVISQTLPGSDPMLLSYDASGNVTSLTPPGRTAHLFAYTAIDEEASYTPPSLPTGSTPTARSYDVDDRLSRITLPDPATVDFAYDAAGRLDTITLARGVVDLNYDTADRVSGISAPGGLTLAFSYDGGLLTSNVAGGTVAGTVGRTYDTSFRPSAISLNGGNAVSLTYDADSLLTQVGSLGLTRDPHHGRVTATTLGVVTDTRTYNGFGELTAYTASANGAAQFSQQYTRDALGRTITRTETIGAVSDTYAYAYDAAGRLASVQKNGAVVEEYTYDPTGNRLSGTGASGAYDAQDRLTQYDTTLYAYTPSGTLAATVAGPSTTTYSYDPLGNLVNATLPAGPAITYLIDGRQRRIGKLVDGTLVQGFLYESDLRPIAELDGTGAVVSRFVYATRLNLPDYLVKGGVTYRIITDQLGSPRLVLNTTTGAIVQRIDYDTFGNVVSDTNPGFQPFGFAGGLYDAGTKLVRFGTRDYDPETGRWTTKDPIGFGGGQSNLYAYVQSDPINNSDAFGLCRGDYKKCRDKFIEDYFGELARGFADLSSFQSAIGQNGTDVQRDFWEGFLEVGLIKGVPTEGAKYGGAYFAGKTTGALSSGLGKLSGAAKFFGDVGAAFGLFVFSATTTMDALATAHCWNAEF